MDSFIDLFVKERGLSFANGLSIFVKGNGKNIFNQKPEQKESKTKQTDKQTNTE